MVVPKVKARTGPMIGDTSILTIHREHVSKIYTFCVLSRRFIHSVFCHGDLYIQLKSEIYTSGQNRRFIVSIEVGDLYMYPVRVGDLCIAEIYTSSQSRRFIHCGDLYIQSESEIYTLRWFIHPVRVGDLYIQSESDIAEIYTSSQSRIFMHCGDLYIQSASDIAEIYTSSQSRRFIHCGDLYIQSESEIYTLRRFIHPVKIGDLCIEREICKFTKDTNKVRTLLPQQRRYPSIIQPLR